MIGQTVGAYRITEKIGIGGFATVYKAEDTETGEIVALKVLHQQYAEDSEFTERFRREAEAIRDLPDSIHLVKLKEYSRAEDAHCLVMEYLTGRDLSQILAERRALTINEALNVTAQVATALECAHQGGVIHRDIKPQNIRITPEGVVKVMDFGIARATEGTRLTQTGAFIGTPQYMAPEIWEGKPADRRSDIYSLGIVLHEMITGKVPFDGDSYAAVMRKHLREKHKPPSTRRAETPRQIDWIVARCLDKDPRRRYQSAARLLSDLQNWQEVKPHVEPPQQVARPRPEVAKPPGAVPTYRPLGHSLKSAVKQVTATLSRFSSAVERIPPAYLVGTRGIGASYRHSLARQDTILGRASNSSIILDDRHVSPHHARIMFARGQFILYDLRSHNGTYVNGSRMRQPIRLQNGDRIEMGRSEFEFRTVQQPRQPSRVSYGRAVAQNDRLAAAICHGSVIAVPVLVSLVVWAALKDRSHFLEFQAKQAVLYQLLFMLVLLIRQYTYLSILPFELLWLAASAYGCYAAYQCYIGLNFEYPVIVDLAKRW